MSVLLRGWDSPAAFCRVGTAHPCYRVLDQVLVGECPRYAYLGGDHDLLSGASAQRLQLFKRKFLCDKSHRAVGEGEVGPARMAAAEDAGPILQRGEIATRRHPVVDRLWEC